MSERVVYVNRQDPEFGQLVEWADLGFEIVNAPRPLPAQHEWQGPFRAGIFYAASEPWMAEQIRPEWDALHASRVVIVDNAEIKRKVEARMEEAGEDMAEILESWGSWPELARADGWPWYGGDR